MSIKVVAFDADDTLWDNEPFFQNTENKFCQLFEDYLPRHTVSRELYQTEIKNISLYGYGVKAFMLSMIETAIRISGKTVKAEIIEKVIEFGREHLEMPVELMNDVKDVLSALKGRYKLVMATKGDLLDQERKLKKSGLESYFHHIEIMSEKKEDDFKKLIRHLDIRPDEFIMIGNSIKSDIIPVLNVGGHGIHIPYHLTWKFEKAEARVDHPNFRQVGKIGDVLAYL